MAREYVSVSTFVKGKILQIVNDPNDARRRAKLAQMRRGIGKQPGSIPELWDIVWSGLPEDMVGKSREPSRSEWAIYASLTLYALHQQGKTPGDQNMHVPGVSLGTAVRRLVDNEDDEARYKKRFDAIATANDLSAVVTHARGLIQLFKAKDIPLDYGQLADDFYWVQFPEHRESVRLRWGRDFYHISNREGQE